MAIANVSFDDNNTRAHDVDMQLGVRPSYIWYRDRRGVDLIDSLGRDWHANLTITLGELYEGHAIEDLPQIIAGVLHRFTAQPMYANLLKFYNEKMETNLTLEEYLTELGEQISNEFLDQYYTREINAETVREWLHFFTTNLRRSANKWLPLLQSFDPYENGWEDWQERRLDSQYPASSIKGAEDYGDSGADIQHSQEYSRKNLAYWQWLMQLLQQYGDPIQAILDDMGVLFHGLLKVEAVSMWDGKPGAGSGYIW